MNDKFTSVDARFATQFENVDTHFALIERQRVEQKQDTADRAITKSDAAASERLRQLSTTFTTAIAAVGGSIADAKERITALESIRLGGKENLFGCRNAL